MSQKSEQQRKTHERKAKVEERQFIRSRRKSWDQNEHNRQTAKKDEKRKQQEEIRRD